MACNLLHCTAACSTSTGCRWISAPLLTSMGCRDTTHLIMAFIEDCRRISSLVPGAPPPPPSSLTLVSAELFLSHFPASLSHLLCHIFFTLKYFFTFIEALPVSFMGLVLATGRSVLELAGAGCCCLCLTWGQLPVSSHRSHHCSPPATKTLPHKPNTMYHDKQKIHYTLFVCTALIFPSQISLLKSHVSTLCSHAHKSDTLLNPKCFCLKHDRFVEFS